MNVKRILIVSVLIATFIFCCREVRDSAGSLPSFEPEPEEYEVYSALIDRSSSEHEDTVIISDSTVPAYVTDAPHADLNGAIFRKGSYFPHFDGYEISISEIGWDTLEDFERKNQYPASLDYQFNIKKKYLLFSKEEHIEIDQRGPYWGEFFERYPGSEGRIAFSRVGFNHDKSKAVVYYSWRGGHRSGAGYFILFYKTNGVWVPKNRIQVWIS